MGKSNSFLREQFAEGTLRLFAIPGFEGDVRVRIPRGGYESSHLLQEVTGHKIVLQIAATRSAMKSMMLEEIQGPMSCHQEWSL